MHNLFNQITIADNFSRALSLDIFMYFIIKLTTGLSINSLCEIHINNDLTLA